MLIHQKMLQEHSDVVSVLATLKNLVVQEPS